MTYDPMRDGARCDLCILAAVRVGGPVPSELNPSARFALVGEGPGEEEVRQNRPFVGPSGQELDIGLRIAGVDRSQVAFLNAFACRPANNDLGRVEKLLKRENDRRKKANTAAKKAGEIKSGETLPGHERLYHPIDACRPRLIQELARGIPGSPHVGGGFTDILSVGKRAYTALTNQRTAVTAVRGGMMDGWLDDHNNKGWRFYRAEGPFEHRPPTSMGHRMRLMPTIHPAFVLRARRWTKAFRSDIGRAVNWFAGTLAWREPRRLIKPTPAQLDQFLRAHGTIVADVETKPHPDLGFFNGIDDQLTCFGFGTPDLGVVVPWESKFSTRRIYSDTEQAEIIEIVRAWAERCNRKEQICVGHNFTYDAVVFLRQLGVEFKRWVDTLLLHKNVESELPHNLGYVVSIYVPLSPAWKADKTATTAETDEQLYIYNARDVTLNAQAFPPLFEHVVLRQQDRVYKEMDAPLQRMTMGMKLGGLPVDQKRRSEWENVLRYGGSMLGREWKGSHQYLKELRDIVGEKFNPNSVQQVRELFYKTRGLPVVLGANGKPKLTKGGDPSTDDEAMRALRIHPQATPEDRYVIDLMRGYRSRQKALGTYVLKLRPCDQFADDGFDVEDALAEDPLIDLSTVDIYEEIERVQAQRLKERTKKRGIVMANGRMYPDYSLLPVSGRLSSRNTNAQNFPWYLRDIVRAPPGYRFVGADSDQIELRLAAALWRLEKYLEVFAAGGDPHGLTALTIFGDAYLNAQGYNSVKDLLKGEAKKLRDLSKRVKYASIYGATPETVWRVITSAEDKAGRLIYAHYTKPEVRQMQDAWYAGVPQLQAGWNAALSFYKANGYTQEPIFGRRRDFLDGENPQEIYNFEIQAGAASIMWLCAKQLLDEVPFEYAGPGTGLLTQTHDSFLLQVPDHDAERVRAILQDAMRVTHPAVPDVTFMGAAEIGDHWAAV